MQKLFDNMFDILPKCTFLACGKDRIPDNYPYEQIREVIMDATYSPAIEALQKKLEEAERRPAALRLAINTLCEEAGIPPLYPTESYSSNQRDSQKNISQIGPDTFFGKKQQTAVREYLDMRKKQDPANGPATPREIYDALVTGGYQFEAKSDDIALVGLRALLRKRYLVFQKLPNGKYGLVSWYPDVKQKKGTGNQTADPQDDEESAD